MIKLILFGILKGIGILLLVLLLLLLLMVLVVLLSPIRYHLEGEKRAAVSGSFGVSWLFGAIRADGGYTPEGGSRLKLRVLWFTPVGGEEKPKKEEKEEEKERAGADRNTCGGKRIKRGTGTGRAKTGA